MAAFGTTVPAVRRLHPALGAEIVGIDASEPLSPAERGVVQDAVETHGVGLLRGQRLTDSSLARFTAQFGPVFGAGQPYGPGSIGMDGVFHVSNLDADGRLLPADSRTLRRGLANRLWHTDSTYLKPRATLSLLYGQVTTPTGGETEFCDTRLAFEALDAAMQDKVRGLTARHAIQHSRKLAGFEDWSEADQQRLAPVARPLAHRHAPTGREALCLASHIFAIDGLSPQAAAALLADLIAIATRPEGIYTHRWRPGDLLIWDNRCTMHRARPHDPACPRDMRSARVVDTTDG